MLSLSDFIVCTFSSNLCRLAYEIQQQRTNRDNHWRFKSLDDMWQFNIKWDTKVSHYQEVIIPHLANNPREINVEVGDILNIENNLWNGYAIGKNVRINSVKFYDSRYYLIKLQAVKSNAKTSNGLHISNP